MPPDGVLRRSTVIPSTRPSMCWVSREQTGPDGGKQSGWGVNTHLGYHEGPGWVQDKEWWVGVGVVTEGSSEEAVFKLGL